MARPYAGILQDYPTNDGCSRCGNPLGDLFFVLVTRMPERPEATKYLCWDCYGPGDPLEKHEHAVRCAVGPDGSLTVTKA